MRARATMRSNDLVFATVAGETSEGNEYAFVAIATSYRYFRKIADNVREKNGGEGGKWSVVRGGATSRTRPRRS